MILATNKRETELLKFVKNRIIADIKDSFMVELHINGRVYDNKPLVNDFFGEMSVDDRVLLLIESYVDYTVNNIIHCED